MNRIGILGGTFDPIHNGHLLLGKAAHEQYNLDKILVMVSPNPPHKSHRHISDVSHRNAMVKLAIKNFPYMQFSDFEQKRQGYIYTSDTLKLLHEAIPDSEFYFIIGGDSLRDLGKWHNPHEVLNLAVILAAGRDNLYDSELDSLIKETNNKYRMYGADIRPLHMDLVKTSSTSIRNGNCMDTPAEVYDYIVRHNLYGSKNIKDRSFI